MKVSDQVENILKFVPDTRNSDKELFIIYMRKFGMNLNPEQESKFRKMASFETIRRSRQLLQEQGKYPASEEVDKSRFEKFRAMRQDYTIIFNEESPDSIRR